MSLTNIQLPDSIIADLYRQMLVEDDTAVPVEKKQRQSVNKTIPAAGGKPETAVVGEVPAAATAGHGVQAVETPINSTAGKTAGQKTGQSGARDGMTQAETNKKGKGKAAATAEENPVNAQQQQPAATLPEKKADPAPAAGTSGSSKTAGGYKALGNNKKNVSVIVHFPTEVFLPEAELGFLTKMLGACKLNLADVAIINHATVPVEIEKLKEQLQPRSLLLFGVEPTDIQLPISFPAYKEQAYAGTTYLLAPGLAQLNQETEEAKVAKRKLWDSLKRLFV